MTAKRWSFISLRCREYVVKEYVGLQWGKCSRLCVILKVTRCVILYDLKQECIRQEGKEKIVPRRFVREGKERKKEVIWERTEANDCNKGNDTLPQHNRKPYIRCVSCVKKIRLLFRLKTEKDSLLQLLIAAVFHYVFPRAVVFVWKS